jgi:hypothetical protein
MSYVEDRDLLILLLVETVGQGRSRRLIDDAQHVESGDPAGVLRRLALRVVEVGRHGDDRLRHRVAEVVLGGLLHLLQDHGGDLGRGIPLALYLDHDRVVRARNDHVRYSLRLFRHFRGLAPHEPLDRKDGVLGVGDGLALRDLADEALAVLGEADDRRRRPSPLGVGDDDGVATFHHGHDRVRRAKVNADYFIRHLDLKLVLVLNASHHGQRLLASRVPTGRRHRNSFEACLCLAIRGPVFAARMTANS